MVRKPSSLSSDSTTASRNSTKYPPSVLSNSWDADDEEDSMSMEPDDYILPRPQSMAVPKASSIHVPYCPRRPNLREILANTSEPPWTLTAFMAYLSNNHCLETLEFTMDAGRYKKHYTKMLAKASGGGVPPAKDRDFVQELWERLVDAYIQPSGSREVNIPSNVRDPILSMRGGDLPPPPEALDPAVAKIYELMEESVLVPFLNSVYPRSSSPGVAMHPMNNSEESLHGQKKCHENRSSQDRLNRHARKSHQPPAPRDSYSQSNSPPSAQNRKSAPSAFHSSNKALSLRLSQTTSNPARSSVGTLGGTTSGSDVNVSGSASGPGMTDDSGSADSPTYESPATPPTTPPLGDANIKRDSGMWKRLGRLSGMKSQKKRPDSELIERQ